VLLGFLLHTNVSAQVSEQWVSRYNSGNIQDFTSTMSMKTDNAGNIYVSGISIGAGSQEDFVTIKYNNSGAQQWAIRYNSPGNGPDIPSSIAVDNLGNVYVTGKTFNTLFDYDAATIKYNSDGIQQWAVIYSGDSNSSDYANSIAVNNSGDVFITGTSKLSNQTGVRSDFLTVKYNSSGILQWTSKYHGAANEENEGFCIALDNLGNIYAAGECSEFSGLQDYCVIKYNSSGSQIWKANYNSSNIHRDIISGMVLDTSGNVYVTGSAYTSGSGLDYETIKYSSSGQRLWVVKYSGSNSDDWANSISIDNSGNIYVTGQSIANGLFGCATIKYNTAGVQQWVARYQLTQSYSASASEVKLDNSGNVYIVGQTSQSPETGYYDFLTVKYNQAGVQQWFKTYNGTGNYYDEGLCISLDNNENIIVAGYSDGTVSLHNKDITTIKYIQQVGITPISFNVPDNFSLFQNYPNPFNPTTKIKFDLPKNSFVKIIVFDITGRMISELVNTNLQEGSYETEFNGENLSSGIYYYTIEAGSFIETRKMILVK
jgi:uncharacterized delta-60 repeat protein